MSRRRIIGLVVAAALTSAAGAAHAADGKGKPMDFTVRAEPTSVAPSASKAVKWDARKGRWGVTLNFDQPEARPSSANDVQAGAYFRITPSLRVGGAVSLGDQRMAPGPKKITPDDGQPRVRLESSFKF